MTKLGYEIDLLFITSTGTITSIRIIYLLNIFYYFY